MKVCTALHTADGPGSVGYHHGAHSTKQDLHHSLMCVHVCVCRRHICDSNLLYKCKHSCDDTTNRATSTSIHCIPAQAARHRQQGTYTTAHIAVHTIVTY